MKYLTILALILVTLISCEEESTAPIVITEDILYLSGEQIRMSGRIYDNGGYEVTEHGFEIAQSNEFDNPIEILLGATTSLGQFIGFEDALNMGEEYFFRAFMVVHGERIYGVAKNFQSLQTKVQSFSPFFAYANEKLTIIGSNFSKDTKVFFDDVEAQIVEIQLESIIEVIIPEVSGNPQVTISVEVNGQKIAFNESFEYIYGEWNRVGDFGSDLRFYEGLYFQIGNTLITGLGFDEISHNTTMWKFDLDTKVWGQLPFSSYPVRSPFFNKSGYFGSGSLDWNFEGGDPTMADEFWRYNNGAFEFLGTTPFQLYKAVSFAFGQYIYVAGGLNGKGGYHFGFFRYDVNNGEWEQLEDIPSSFNADTPHFEHNNIQYFIDENEIVWTYDPINSSWSQIGLFPVDWRRGGMAAVIGDKAYVGLFANDNRIWEYDILNNSWKQKAKSSDAVDNKNSSLYVHDSKLYVIRINPTRAEKEIMAIWEFDPEKF